MPICFSTGKRFMSGVVQMRCPLCECTWHEHVRDVTSQSGDCCFANDAIPRDDGDHCPGWAYPVAVVAEDEHFENAGRGPIEGTLEEPDRCTTRIPISGVNVAFVRCIRPAGHDDGQHVEPW